MKIKLFLRCIVLNLSCLTISWAESASPARVGGISEASYTFELKYFWCMTLRLCTLRG